MYTHDARIQTRVGIFVLLGIAVVAATVVYFGRLGRTIERFYSVQVDFPNASGLIKGSDVLLGGARIGYVADPPRVLPAMQGVAVNLKIRQDIAVPVQSRFIVGNSGLLGNRFVDVLVDPKADLTKRLESGAIVKGERESGIEDLTRDSSEMLADIRKAVGTLNTALERLDKTALSEASLTDLREAIANIKRGSAGFTDIGKASADLQAAAADARKFISSARTGSGPLPMILNDKQAASDLRAILSNVRRHGVVWYKDSYPGPSPSGRQ